MVDPEEYISNRPTTYSHVYLEYEPSPALNESLRQFIHPDMRIQRRFAQIALWSESYLKAPTDPRERAIKHPAALAQNLSNYERGLKAIESHQLRLASFLDMRMLKDKSLNIHFEVLPNEVERRMLGQIALKDWEHDKTTIGVVAHIPTDALDDPYGAASAQLRGLFATSHPSMHNRRHSTPAPLANGLWVQRPTLRDIVPPPVVIGHKDIISNE